MHLRCQYLQPPDAWQIVLRQMNLQAFSSKRAISCSMKPMQFLLLSSKKTHVEGTGSTAFCCSAKCFDAGLRRLRRFPNLCRVLNFFSPFLVDAVEQKRWYSQIFTVDQNYDSNRRHMQRVGRRGGCASRDSFACPAKGFLPISCEDSLNCGVNFLIGKISSALCGAIFAFVSVREGVFHSHKAKVAQRKEWPTRRCTT